jgi:hypothetical protein
MHFSIVSAWLRVRYQFEVLTACGCLKSLWWWFIEHLVLCTVAELFSCEFSEKAGRVFMSTLLYGFLNRVTLLLHAQDICRIIFLHWTFLGANPLHCQLGINLRLRFIVWSPAALIAAKVMDIVLWKASCTCNQDWVDVNWLFKGGTVNMTYDRYFWERHIVVAVAGIAFGALVRISLSYIRWILIWILLLKRLVLA